MNALQRHPWVIMCYFSVAAGFWVSLWTGLEGWWLPFGIALFGLAVGVAGICLWQRVPGGPPKFSDYLTLVKTPRKLVLQATERGRQWRRQDSGRQPGSWRRP